VHGGFEKGQRPWGYYEVLIEEALYKVKKVVVYPGMRLSLQRHKKRSEHWHIVKGEALITIDKKSITLSKKQSIDIPKETIHRIENVGKEDLLFIEVQSGTYLGEDDIERFEDDFGRIEVK